MIERLMRADYLGKEDISAVRKSFDGKYKSHWHEFYEIEYIISGSGIYEIDGIEYKITPGTLFFMTPVDFHNVNANNVELYNIQFSAFAANTEILAEITERNFPTFFELKGKKEMKSPFSPLKTIKLLLKILYQESLYLYFCTLSYHSLQ